MINIIQWTCNKMQLPAESNSIEFLSEEEIAKARFFHKSFPQYSQTPLRSLHNLAGSLGIGGLYVKDESHRFGLNAFKVLGGSYAMGKVLARRLNEDISTLPYERLVSPAVKSRLGDITFTTATDGNHGRGVAWTARELGQRSVVYMPKGSSPIRLANIQAEGADAAITALNYDDAVRLAAQNAAQYGWEVVQDTAWQGYEDIPAWIMQGYGTMAWEALQQLQHAGVQKPTHVLLQAGVGSLAGAVAGYLINACGRAGLKLIIVEADQADCLYQSALANDGRPRAVGGDMATIMAGLACGEVNSISWNILRDHSDLFVSCPDWVAAKGMRMLGNPLLGDARVVSGESGAVTTGLLWALVHRPELAAARQALAFDDTSQVLVFSTEGDTDPDSYRDIVWDGRLPSYRI